MEQDHWRHHIGRVRVCVRRLGFVSSHARWWRGAPSHKPPDLPVGLVLARSLIGSRALTGHGAILLFRVEFAAWTTVIMRFCWAHLFSRHVRKLRLSWTIWMMRSWSGWLPVTCWPNRRKRWMRVSM